MIHLDPGSVDADTIEVNHLLEYVLTRGSGRLRWPETLAFPSALSSLFSRCSQRGMAWAGSCGTCSQNLRNRVSSR
jgi:hypothetical protein